MNIVKSPRLVLFFFFRCLFHTILSIAYYNETINMGITIQRTDGQETQQYTEPDGCRSFPCEFDKAFPKWGEQGWVANWLHFRNCGNQKFFEITNYTRLWFLTFEQSQKSLQFRYRKWGWGRNASPQGWALSCHLTDPRYERWRLLTYFLSIKVLFSALCLLSLRTFIASSNTKWLLTSSPFLRRIIHLQASLKYTF